MKRIFLVMLSVVFFVSSTFAQLPPAQMRERLAGKVEKAAQEASVKNLQEARSLLAIAYLSGMFGVVDEVLTQYPELVNETIKGEDGKPIPMVYHAFSRPKQPTKSQQQLMQQIKALEQKRAELHEYAEELDYFSKKAERARKTDSELYQKIRALELELGQEKSRNASAENLMLAVFYKHGAKCEQCLKESFTEGPVTPSQQLTLLYQLPVFGASADEMAKLQNLEKWIPLAKQIEVTPDSLKMLLTKVPNSKMVMNLLELAYSKDQATQRMVASYKTGYKRLQSQNADEERILAGSKLLHWQLDLVLPLLKRFPSTDFKGWKYYRGGSHTAGYNLADGVGGEGYFCYFTEPVVVDTEGIAYSINPKKFGTRQKPNCDYINDVDG